MLQALAAPAPAPGIQARIELGPLAEPERAIALADRAIRDWPADALVSEARDLRCRALRQIGRGDECATAPRP